MRLHWLLTLLGTLNPAAPVCAPAACVCAAPPPPQQARAEATAVFVGTVTSVRDSTLVEDGFALPVRVATFRVHGAWKGVVAGTAAVTTGSGGGDCGIPFREGVKYLVYADGPSDRLSASACSRTTPASRAAGDLAWLGRLPAGRAP